jgi:hypothetical protein
VELAAKAPRPVQQVHSIGNSGASEALWVYSSGTVRQVYDKRFALAGGQVVEAGVLETQSPINPGNSGGPLVNDDGQLVGLVSASRRDAALVSLGIGVGELRALLRGDIKTIDRGVRAALGRLGLQYTVNDLGVFRLDFRMADGDRHAVFIGSQTEPLGKARVREVWAFACASDKPLPAELVRKALEENLRWKIGAWAVHRQNGKESPVFCARVPADFDPDSLGATIRAVLQVSYQAKKAAAPAEAPKDGAAK